MFGKYILKGKTPVAASSTLEWVRWFYITDCWIVKRTRVGSDLVSTVFFGLDYPLGTDPPLLFQTEISGWEDYWEHYWDRDEDKWRYSTWEEAEVGHDRVVAELSDLLKEDRRKGNSHGLPIHSQGQKTCCGIESH